MASLRCVWPASTGQGVGKCQKPEGGQGFTGVLPGSLVSLVACHGHPVHLVRPTVKGACRSCSLVPAPQVRQVLSLLLTPARCAYFDTEIAHHAAVLWLRGNNRPQSRWSKSASRRKRGVHQHGTYSIRNLETACPRESPQPLAKLLRQSTSIAKHSFS